MTALQTTLDVLSHSARFSAAAVFKKFTGAGPWTITSTNGGFLLNAILAMTAAQLADGGPDHTARIVALIDNFTRSHHSQPPLGRVASWSKSIAWGAMVAALVELAQRHRASLPAGTWDRLIVCVAHEMQAKRAMRVPYWKQPDGSFRGGMRSGDSKSEEVGWLAQGYHAATLLGIVGYEALREEAILASFAVPQDGLPKGYNVDADFEVENHMMPIGTKPGDPAGTPIKPNPRYQKAAHGAHENIARLSQVFGMPPPVGLFRHLPAMYGVLTTRQYAGRTIYQSDGSIYFPAGDDRPAATNVMSFALTDAVVARHHPDAGVRALALDWCGRHAQRMLDMQLAMQAAMGVKWDGRAFPGKGQVFNGKDQELASNAAMTHWALTR